MLEPVHAVSYFSPEPLAALRDAGFRGFWMGYFAARAAPLGEVGPELVHALFYNFGYERVARALPAAWQHGSVADALSARRQGSVAALRRLLGPQADDPAVERAAELALLAAGSAPLPGRPLYAANRTLRTPTDPVGRLWHATTLLREHRGDGHVGALLSGGVSGRESHVLLSLSRKVPREVYRTARDYDDDEWARCLQSLRTRGLADATGLTPDGRLLVDWIESVTDERAAEAFTTLSQPQREELRDALSAVTRAVIRGGDIPLDSPMGLDLRRVAGDNAQTSPASQRSMR